MPMDADAIVIAHVTPTDQAEITLLVHDGWPTKNVDYAERSLLAAHDGEDVIATSSEVGVATAAPRPPAVSFSPTPPQVIRPGRMTDNFAWALFS